IPERASSLRHSSTLAIPETKPSHTSYTFTEEDAISTVSGSVAEYGSDIN
ncbi:unnamed protein product, partial [Candidula unifasciata]